MKKLIKFSLAAALAASFANAAVYEIDPAHSNVGFKIKHLSISKVSGNFGKFDAVIDYDKDAPPPSASSPPSRTSSTTPSTTTPSSRSSNLVLEPTSPTWA